MTRHLIAFLIAALLCAPALAADFYPISAATSSTSGTDLWPVSNLIQGPGVGIDAAEPHDKILAGADGNWVTDAPGGFPSDYIAAAGMPVLTFDLGQDVPLSEVSVWGYATTNTNGASEYQLKFATEADGTSGFGDTIAYNPTFTATIDDTVRQSSPFSEGVTARYVEMTITDNHFVAPGDGSEGEIPGGDRAGLGEVAFQIPEPSAISLLLIGSLALLRRRR